MREFLPFSFLQTADEFSECIAALKLLWISYLISLKEAKTNLKSDIIYVFL